MYVHSCKVVDRLVEVLYLYGRMVGEVFVGCSGRVLWSIPGSGYATYGYASIRD